MQVLIIAHFMQTPSENGNSRFTYIANLLGDKKENQIELITSSFSHKYKEQRVISNEPIDKLNYKLKTINEPGYKKNVSLKRFYSHYIMGKNLKKYLNKLDYKPDVIYCAVPSLDVGRVTAKYAKKNNIRFIIDVQDLWPEAFKMVFNLPIISNLIFWPMKKLANYIYKNADDIVAVSETYANRASGVNEKYKHKLSVFLGTDLDFFDECKKKNKCIFDDEIIRIAYIGTLGHSYDIKCIIDAIKLLNDREIKNIKFVIMGDGPLKQEFENYAKQKNIDSEFTGRLPYEEMVGKLCSCDIAVNPIMHNAAQSIINKVGDYAAAGLPVVSTQECEEYRKLVENYNIGFNCDNGNIQDISEKLERLIKNKELRTKMGENNRKLAEEKFDRRVTYKQIVDLVMKE